MTTEAIRTRPQNFPDGVRAGAAAAARRRRLQQLRCECWLLRTQAQPETTRGQALLSLLHAVRRTMLDAPPAAFADRLAWRLRNSDPTLPEASTPQFAARAPRRSCTCSTPLRAPPCATRRSGAAGSSRDRPQRVRRPLGEQKAAATQAVAGRAAIVQAMRAAFGATDRVVEFSGREPLPEQASLFARASLVVGPHGAALANTLFCADGTPVVEYHRHAGGRSPTRRCTRCSRASSASSTGPSSTASAAPAVQAFVPTRWWRRRTRRCWVRQVRAVVRGGDWLS